MEPEHDGITGSLHDVLRQFRAFFSKTRCDIAHYLFTLLVSPVSVVCVDSDGRKGRLESVNPKLFTEVGKDHLHIDRSHILECASDDFCDLGHDLLNLTDTERGLRVFNMYSYHRIVWFLVEKGKRDCFLTITNNVYHVKDYPSIPVHVLVIFTCAIDLHGSFLLQQPLRHPHLLSNLRQSLLKEIRLGYVDTYILENIIGLL
jgi:hypothetical protein